MTTALDTPWGRLRALRVAAGFDTAKALAREVDFAAPTVTAHERGPDNGRAIRKDAAEKYAETFTRLGIPVRKEWIMFGTGPAPDAFAGSPLSRGGSRPHDLEPDGRLANMPHLDTECVHLAAVQIQTVLQEEQLQDTPENIALAIVELAADHTRKRRESVRREISLGNRVISIDRLTQP